MRRALTALALACVWTGAARADETGLQRSVRLVGELRHAEALAAARGDEDPLRRQQAITYVLDQGGDLEGALAAARAGLELAPGDTWLLERAAGFALGLHRAELAVELAGRWRAAIAAAGGTAEELDAQAARAAQLALEVGRLARSARRQEVALARARWTSALFLAAVLALMARLSRSSSRAGA